VALFSFEAVSLQVDGVPILDGVELAVPDEGITVVSGPSGSGKSTLLRTCNRLEVPTSGVVRFRGDDVASLDPLHLRRRVGMVFQRPTVFAGTVRDNLLVAAPDADGATLADALERVGLPPAHLDRRADDLSGGEAQRACLARTLLTEPEVLLMDEPTSSLDPAATRVLERLGREVADGGARLVWVTHDEAQAGRIGDHHVELDRGRVVRASMDEDDA
jgi:putative ABC transport system ATP-binding protein